MQVATGSGFWNRAGGWRIAPSLLIFGVGVTLSAMLFQFMRAEERADAQGAFEQRAGVLARNIERDLAAHLQFIHQYQAGGQASADSEATDFGDSYATIIRPLIRSTLRSAPGFEAAQFVGIVPEELRASAESAMRDLLQEDFQISDPGPDGLVPAPPRSYHLPIYVSDSATGPIDEGGLDLARDPQQVDAFTRIAASGEMAAWPVSTWEVNEPLLRYRIAMPTYTAGTPPATAAERLASLTGFNSFLLRPDVLFGLSLGGGRQESIDVHVYDDGLAGSDWSGLIFVSSASSEGASTGATSNKGPRWGTTMALADRIWRVEFTPSAGYGSAGSWLSWGAFASGVAISGLIAMYLLTVVRFEAKRRAYLTESNTALAAEVAERRQVEAALRRSEGQYRAVVEQVQEVIFQSDAGGRWTFLNPAWADITGFSIEESLGLTALEFVQSDDARQMAEQFEAVVHGTQDSFRMEVRHLTKNGGIRWLDVYACALRDEAGTLTGLSGTLADVTERKEFEARLAHQAYHDALTDLPNRAGFTSRLGAALERAEMSRSTVALLMLDLDGFKEINDTYGHPAGDVLLVEVGRRLRASVAEADFVARLGGDEFTIILERPDEVVDAQGVPTRVLAALSSPVMWNGHDLAVSASIGIAESTPGERPERDELVRRADVALYEAKAAGKGRAIPFRHAETLAPLRRSA